MENGRPEKMVIQVDLGDVEYSISESILEVNDAIQTVETSISEIEGVLSDGFDVVDGYGEKTVQGISDAISSLEEIKTAVEQGFQKIVEENVASGLKDDVFKVIELLSKVDKGTRSSSGKGGKYLRKDTGESGNGIMSLASDSEPMIAGLSELVDLWDSEAAAKALSTAATTAWNAVCSVGTAIAGAFGAAINFLTSPIGLVVIAITALIGIIVLLAANWDKVKAALINGWETVKAFLGTAAEWFNTTIIQPIVTFLTALWTRITTFVSGLMVLLMPYIQQFLLLVQTVLTNIQTFFTGLGEYLTGVFSVNWADQFGAFGEVLNVFFASVQEIWTAVQTIFEGVIQFVTGVFSGDWESAWNGIVQVFTGICFGKCRNGTALAKADGKGALRFATE